MGDLEQAAVVVGLALADEPRWVDRRYHRGLPYWVPGDLERAIAKHSAVYRRIEVHQREGVALISRLQEGFDVLGHFSTTRAGVGGRVYGEGNSLAHKIRCCLVDENAGVVECEPPLVRCW